MSRVCFVTCLLWPDISESDRLVARALERGGVRVEARAWNERAADFGGFDAIVLRSNWDYHFEPEAFLGWLDRLERTGARIFNPPALVRWNVSKRYLIALHAAGVPTVATAVLEDETQAGLEALMRRLGPRHPARDRRNGGLGGGRTRDRSHPPAGARAALRGGGPHARGVVVDLHRRRPDPQRAQAARRR